MKHKTSRDLTVGLRKLAHASVPAQNLERHWGVIQGVAADGTVSVTIAGSSAAVTGVGVLSSYLPVAGDTVMLDIVGSDVVVVGTTRTSAPNANISLLGVGGAAFKVPPTAEAGRFLMQAGSNVVTTNSAGGFALSFPVAFPGGVLTVIPSIGDNSIQNVTVEVIESQVSQTMFGGQAWTASTGTGLNSVGFRLNWLALGW